MALPIKTTIEDCDKIVAYLKHKPSGATMGEAKSVLDSKHLDGRKIKAYEAWRLVKTEGDRMILTSEGRALARDSTMAPAHYLDVINELSPYRSVIERAHHSQHDSLLINDVAALWHDHHQDTLGTTNETSIKDAVTCFFNLVEGAGLGKYIFGRRGQETRVDLDRAAVARFIDGNVSPIFGVPLIEDDHEDDVAEVTEGAELPLVLPPSGKSDIRVFITHGRKRDIVEQIETMLGVTEIDFEVAIETETTAIPVPEKVLGAMRRCTAAIICVSVEEDRKDEGGNYTINENVLIEIGAAFVLYDRKVILLWDKRLPVPSNLQGLYRCEFEGDEIGFKEVMRLMKAVKDFRESEAA